MLRLGFAAWFDLDNMAVIRHVAVIDMGDRAKAAFALPRSELDLRQAWKIKFLMDCDAFRLEPICIGIGLCVIFKTRFRGLSDFHIGAKHYHG